MWMLMNREAPPTCGGCFCGLFGHDATGGKVKHLFAALKIYVSVVEQLILGAGHDHGNPRRLKQIPQGEGNRQVYVLFQKTCRRRSPSVLPTVARVDDYYCKRWHIFFDGDACVGGGVGFP